MDIVRPQLGGLRHQASNDAEDFWGEFPRPLYRHSSVHKAVPSTVPVSPKAGDPGGLSIIRSLGADSNALGFSSRDPRQDLLSDGGELVCLLLSFRPLLRR